MKRDTDYEGCSGVGLSPERREEENRLGWVGPRPEEGKAIPPSDGAPKQKRRKKEGYEPTINVGGGGE